MEVDTPASSSAKPPVKEEERIPPTKSTSLLGLEAYESDDEEEM